MDEHHPAQPERNGSPAPGDPASRDGRRRTIAVTGATGFVGRHLIRTLLGRGLRVRALARSADKARRVLPETDAIEIVEGGALDGSSPERLVGGADACVHLIGIIREAPGGQTFRRLHTEATRAVVRACERSGVGRYVHMSALGARPDGVSAYQRTKFEAERIVLRSGLDWTIFRPGLIVGPDGDFFRQMKRWCESREAPYLFLPYFLRAEVDTSTGRPRPDVGAPRLAPVDVDDVCAAFADALENHDAVQEIYPLVGAQELSWPEMLRATRDALPQANRRLRPIGIPAGLAAWQARAARALGFGALLPFDEGMARMGAEDSVADTAKAAEHLGFRPARYEDRLPDYAAG